ncbi:hypothetical protein WA158_000603 [Blastocystis sp. Blastoise]
MDPAFIQGLNYFSDPRFSSLFFNVKPTPVPKPSLDRPRYKSKKKIRTSIIVLTICLNVGIPPPGVVKPEVCAVEECWYDPYVFETAEKAVLYIGRRLQRQYESFGKALQKIHIKQLIDPSIEVMETNCKKIRGQDSDDIVSGRLVFHYNGHGVPDPTPGGEIWVFNSKYNEYMPISIYVLNSWLHPPCLYVFDCNNAGLLLSHFNEIEEQNHENDESILVLAACDADQKLPTLACLPVDIFTACLTTPIHMCIRWYCSILKTFREPNHPSYYDQSFQNNDDIFLFLPGDLKLRDTPLGKLQWIFESITDTIAWDCTECSKYRMLYRQDEVTATLFRNFLLAQNILGWLDITPVSRPTLENTSKHPLWNTWWSVLDDFFYQFNATAVIHKSIPIVDPLNPLNVNNFDFKTTFFEDQMRMFELEFPLYKSHTTIEPSQLPMLYQIFLGSDKDNVLPLISKYTLQGPEAVELLLSTGIYTYLLRSIQQFDQPNTYLLTIWSRILLYDYTYQSDFNNSRTISFFVNSIKKSYQLLNEENKKNQLQSLGEDSNSTSFEDAFINYEQQMDTISKQYNSLIVADACSVLIFFALCCHQSSGLQFRCIESDIHKYTLKLIEFQHPKIQKWCLLFLTQLIDGNKTAKQKLIDKECIRIVLNLLTNGDPEVRAASLYLLGLFIGYNDNSISSYSTKPSLSPFSPLSNNPMNSLMSSSQQMYISIETPLQLNDMELLLKQNDSSIQFDISLLREVSNTLYIRSELSSLVRREYLRFILKVFIQPVHRARLIYCIRFIERVPSLEQNHSLSIASALCDCYEDDNEIVKHLSAMSPLSKEEVIQLKPSFYIENWVNLKGLLLEEPISLLSKSIYSFMNYIKDNVIQLYPFNETTKSLYCDTNTIPEDLKTAEKESDPFLLPPPLAMSQFSSSTFGNYDLSHDLLSAPTTPSIITDQWLEQQLTLLSLPTTLFSVNIDIISNNGNDSEAIEDPYESLIPYIKDTRLQNMTVAQQKSIYKPLKERICWIRKDVPITCIKFHPSAPLVLTGSLSSITSFNISSGSLSYTLTHNKVQTTGIEWINNSNDPLLAEARGNGTIYIWKSALKDKSRKVHLLSSFSLFPSFNRNYENSPIYLKRHLIKFDQSRGYLIAGGQSKYIKIVDFNSQQLYTKFDITSHYQLTSLDVNNSDPRYFYTNLASLLAYDIRERNVQIIQQYDNQSPIVKCGISSTHLAYIAHYSGAVDTVDLRTNKIVNTFQTNPSLTDFKLHPILPYFATSSLNSTISIWSYDGTNMQTITSHYGLLSRELGSILTIDYSRETNCLASVNTNGECTFFSQD